MARPPRQAGNLPAETSTFIGRRRELAEVRARISAARLVTLAGPGGVGKTRLAIRCAAGLARGFRDGGWLAELAETRNPALVPSAVLRGLNLHDQAAAEPRTLLLSYLRDKELLLILDNCEHLLEPAAGIVSDILRAAPGVRVIATSREPLSVPGENVVQVPPLGAPDPHAPGELAQLRRTEAVMLFTERAAAAAGTFELTAANQTAVVGLCHRLDGLPLAIELAAVRARVLTAEQILDRLTDRFALLDSGARAGVPRHQTLRTTIEWSHDLLPDDEATVLRRTSVFAGRFTLADAESVCMPGHTTPAQALDLLSSLVDKSLVVREDANGLACYRLHETMREFAALKLAESGEREAAEQRCAGHYRHGSGQPVLERRYRLAEWLRWADLEIDNVRAVLQRCADRGDAAVGVELTASMSWYWITRANTEGSRLLDEFLAAEGGEPQVRARAWFIRGFLAVLKADPSAARPALAAAAAAARHHGQPDLLSEALSLASITESLAGHHARAGELLDEAQATVAGLDYPPGQLAICQAQALNGLLRADLDAVTAGGEEGLRLAREAGDSYGLEMMLFNLGSGALVSGDLERAWPLLAESLEIAQRIDDRIAQFYLLAELGCHAAFSGRAQLAARLLAASNNAAAETGVSAMGFLVPVLARAGQVTETALGTARLQAEHTAGASLSRSAACKLALGGNPEDAAPARHDDTSLQPLSIREADIARLLTDGLTNKQIGARLFISERTVDSHVRNILNKLGFSSRAQIAAWIAFLDH